MPLLLWLLNRIVEEEWVPICRIKVLPKDNAQDLELRPLE